MYPTSNITLSKKQLKRFYQLTNADQKSLETAFSIAICRQLGDKWQSKTPFITIFDLRSSIVLRFRSEMNLINPHAAVYTYQLVIEVSLNIHS